MNDIKNKIMKNLHELDTRYCTEKINKLMTSHEDKTKALEKVHTLLSVPEILTFLEDIDREEVKLINILVNRANLLTDTLYLAFLDSLKTAGFSSPESITDKEIKNKQLQLDIFENEADINNEKEIK